MRAHDQKFGSDNERVIQVKCCALFEREGYSEGGKVVSDRTQANKLRKVLTVNKNYAEVTDFNFILTVLFCSLL